MARGDSTEAPHEQEPAQRPRAEGAEERRRPSALLETSAYSCAGTSAKRSGVATRPWKNIISLPENDLTRRLFTSTFDA